MSRTKEECLLKISELNKQWSSEYTKYFDTNIKLEYFGYYSVSKSLPVNRMHGITTNQSDGFNFLVTDFQEWKEAALMLFQGYLEEVNRGLAGLGPYSLRQCYSSTRINIDSLPQQRLVCHPKDIVTALRKKDFVPKTDSSKPTTLGSSKLVHAKEIVCNDGISFSAKLAEFTVSDGRLMNAVKLFPTATTCPVKNNASTCYSSCQT